MFNEIRPTLIIGLGGTGCLGVKKTKEKMPAKFNEVGCVRYIVFDTTTQPTKWMHLSNTEYFDIGGFNANRIIDSIKGDDRYDWFPENLRPGQINLGAMGIRAIGRLCYFQKREEIIRPVLQNALSDITDGKVLQEASQKGFTVTLKRGIDIHIICSVCGGTGAGILLDLVYDLRKWAEQIALAAKIHAHFVLPEAFVKVDAQSMTLLRANAYAFLKEIDYFTRFGNWSVRYRDELVEFEKRTPFDFCYLLNGERKTDTVDRNRLAAIIGETIVVLTASPVGRTMGDQAINLAQHVLSQLDESKKPRAYSSYGISVGEIPYEKMYELGRTELRNEFINAMIENEHVDIKEINTEVDSLLTITILSPDRLKNIEPEISSPHFEGLAHLERKKDQFRGQARRYLDNYLNHNKSEFMKAKSNMDEFKGKFRNTLEEKTVTYINQREKRLPFVQTMLDRLVNRIEEYRNNFSNKVQDFLKEEETTGKNLENSINEALNSGKLTQMEQVSDLLVKNENCKHKGRFYQFACDFCFEAIDYISELRSRYQKISDFLRELKTSSNEYSPIEETLPERFAICDVKDIVETFRKNKDAMVDKFLAEIQADLLSLSKQSALEAGRKLDHLCAEALKRVLDQDPEFDCQNLLFSNGEERAEEILKNQIEAAIPAWRVDDIYPKENIRSISVIGSLADSEVSKFISRLLVNIEPTGTYHRNEIPILQTEHGLSLWGLAKMKEYLSAFRKLQEIEGRTSHQLHLDKNWNWSIPEVFPEKEVDRRAMESFALANMFGWIKQVGLEYCYLPQDNQPIFLGESRHESFLKFKDMNTKNNVNFVEDVNQRVKQKMREIGDNQKICEILDKQILDFEKRVKGIDNPEVTSQIWQERNAIEAFKEKLLHG